MSKKLCAVCNTKIGLFSSKFKLLDGVICAACASNAQPGDRVSLRNGQLTSDQAIKSIQAHKLNKEKVSKFVPTVTPHPCIAIDITNKKVKLTSRLQGEHIEEIINFNDIISWEIITDENTIYKKEGLGRAVVGGALFGGAGAVVGGITGELKGQTVIQSVKVRITIKNINNPIRLIILHEGYDLQTSTDRYNKIMEEVQTLIGALENLQNY